MYTQKAHTRAPAYDAHEISATPSDLNKENAKRTNTRSSELAGGASTHTPSKDACAFTTHDTLQSSNAPKCKRRPGETLPDRVDSRTEKKPHSTRHTSEQTSTRVEHSRSVTDAHQTPSISQCNHPRSHCDTRIRSIQSQGGEAQPQTDKAPEHANPPAISEKSGKLTPSRRTRYAHRGITTQRVTILFDRIVATQRATPNRAAEGATIQSGGKASRNKQHESQECTR